MKAATATARCMAHSAAAEASAEAADCGLDCGLDGVVVLCVLCLEERLSLGSATAATAATIVSDEYGAR